MLTIVTNLDKLRFNKMSISKLQLTDLVIKPVLEKIPKGLSDESLVAIQMIIAHESQRGRYLKQINGPALGLIQMEPTTHNSAWKFGDSIWDNALTLGIITSHEYNNKSHPKPERLIYDLAYNVFMARQRLFMKREKLPRPPAKISMYLKNHWNSVHGAADGYSYLDDWKSWK